jgi:hypothetical protein
MLSDAKLPFLAKRASARASTLLMTFWWRSSQRSVEAGDEPLLDLV